MGMRKKKKNLRKDEDPQEEVNDRNSALRKMRIAGRYMGRVNVSCAPFLVEDNDGSISWSHDGDITRFDRMASLLKTTVCGVEGTAAMEMLVARLSDTEDKVECKRLKKELEEARIIRLFFVRRDFIHASKGLCTYDSSDICRMIKESVDANIAAE
ncbi:hypothetical protein Tco_0807963 [Tanacetum coccineum]